MEHRKRSQWKHKIELPLAVRIAISKNKKHHVPATIHDKNLVRALAIQATESLKLNDKAYLKIEQNQKPVLPDTAMVEN